MSRPRHKRARACPRADGAARLPDQVVEALRACHATGIVHRDVKPQNVIVAAGGPDPRAKLIDLGAAADLRVGINYVPNEFLLDPRYAPPEQYIMSTQARARAPPVIMFRNPGTLIPRGAARLLRLLL